MNLCILVILIAQQDHWEKPEGRKEKKRPPEEISVVQSLMRQRAGPCRLGNGAPALKVSILSRRHNLVLGQMLVIGSTALSAC